MENIKNVIRRHNNRILVTPRNRSTEDKCNCRKKDECPLPGKCLTKNIIYKAEVSTTDQDQTTKTYIGMTSNEFKQRYRNHEKSFNNEKYKNETELSKYVWKLKKEKRNFTTTWSIIKRAAPYRIGSKKCNLCLEEKVEIMKRKWTTTLNKRRELFSKYIHKSKIPLG